MGIKSLDGGASNTVIQHVTFFLLCATGAALFNNPVIQLLRMSFHKDLYSHIPLIPVVSLFILYYRRKEIFTHLEFNWLGGLPLIATGGIFFYSGKHIVGLQEPDYLSMVTCGAVIWLIGSFVLAYGGLAFKKALFPLFFLAFVIPVPTPILDPLVKALQIGSANATYLIFKLTAVPVHREGFLFSIPGITIELAEQCSGIRSSLALIITSVLAGYLFLKKGWSRIVLVLSVFPITVFKNSLRVVTLCLFAAYVDPRFITGSWLHRSGGIPFFILGLMLLAPVLWGLRKGEGRVRREERVESRQ